MPPGPTGEIVPKVSMVGTGILPNNIRSPSPECYTTFWMMTTYSDTLIDRTLHQFKSHTFDLARNERGLIGDRHFVDKRGAANRCGDHLVGAFKMCEVVLDIYKHDYVF